MANKAIGFIAAGAGLFILTLALRRRRRQKGVNRHMHLSKNFELGEFLRSASMPGIATYQPTVAEIFRLTRLATLVLQPLRDQFGPMGITSGLRPETLRGPHGETWHELLRARGFSPARHSDHAQAIAADFIPTKLAVPDWWRVYQAAKNNPDVRQVLLEYRTANDGRVVGSHLHTAVTISELPRLPDTDRALVLVDGKRAEERAYV